MAFSCLIVDDEPLAQEILVKYVSDCPMLQLEGVCSNAFEALELLSSKEIRLLFLDIRMPVLSGLQFLQTVTSPPLVIFTTAYPEYALEGFESDAVDYLLKPFSFERFLRAVRKALQLLPDRLQSLPPEPIIQESGHSILLRADKKVHRVDVDQILYLHSTGDYVKVCCNDRSLVVHDTLSHMQVQLSSDRFLRVHKSYVVAFDKIDYIEGNQIKVGRVMIPLGAGYREAFMRRMKVIPGVT